MSRRVLFISNGHGEDRVAAAIAARWTAPDTELAALPIVGSGNAYRALNIPIVGPTATMPSGGFILHDQRALAADLRGGLVRLTALQLRALWQIRRDLALVVAVGDLVPLALAWLSRAPYALVGCAKSDYYVDGRFSDYFPHERWLLARRRCLAIYPRDRLTAANLSSHGFRAWDLGNPMMDDILGAEPDPGGDPAARDPQPLPVADPVIGLLPGSRDEAHGNFAELLESCRGIAAMAPDGIHVRFSAAIADSLNVDRLLEIARAASWTPRREDGAIALFGPAGESLVLPRGSFGEWCRSVHAVVGLAGTANEQCAGLGLPVVVFPGRGPQFDERFARRQVRLLGESILLVDGPAAVAEAVWSVLRDPARRSRIVTNGRLRMGSPGASLRIAAHLAGVLAELPPR